jgi:hypothetical protein
MAIIITDDGRLEVGPPDPDDPTRQAHKRLLDELAWHLETTLQADDCHSTMIERHKAQLAALESRVAMLESLLLSASAA